MHQLCGQVKRDITHLHLKSLIKSAQIDMMLNMVTGWLQLILDGITEDVCRDLPSALPFMQVAIDRVQKTWKQCNACDKMIADAVSSGKLPYVEPRVIQKIPGQVASKKNAVALSARELISRIMNTSQKRCDTMWESSEVCKCHGMHAGCARALMRALWRIYVSEQSRYIVSRYTLSPTFPRATEIEVRFATLRATTSAVLGPGPDTACCLALIRTLRMASRALLRCSRRRISRR